MSAGRKLYPVTMTSEAERKQALDALRTYTFILRNAPDSYFQDYSRQMVFAAVMNCEALSAAGKDEFSLRSAVQLRIAALRAEALAMPAAPLRISLEIYVGQYDFTRQGFNLPDPSGSADGAGFELITFPGSLYGVNRRSAATTKSAYAKLPYCVTGDPMEFAIVMQPFYFNKPEFLAMDQRSAQALIVEMPDRRLVFEAIVDGAGTGYRTREEALARAGKSPISIVGPYVKLRVLDWRVRTKGGRVLTQMSANPPIQPMR